MADFKPIADAIAAARQRDGGRLAPLLGGVNFRAVVERDAIHVQRQDQAAVSFPIVAGKMTRGFYFVKLEPTLHRMIPLNGRGVYRGIQAKDGSLQYQEETDQSIIDAPFVFKLTLARDEFLALRAGTSGVYWVTVDTPARPRSDDEPKFDEFPLERYPSIPAANLLAVLKELTREPVAIEGPGPGVSRFWPDHREDKPLNFTYLGYTGHLTADRDDRAMLVKRAAAGRDFHFRVPVGDVKEFLFSYVIEVIGRNTAGMAMYAQMVVEITTSLLPIVGPLYSLFQTGRGVYQAVKNWDKMTGFDKALLGLDVLLTVVTLGPKGVRAAKGLAKLDEGTRALTAAGMPAREAKNLMLAAGLLDEVPATRQIVEKLIEQVKSGKPLSAKQIKQLESVLEAMIKRLPASERALAAARFAMTSAPRARAFLDGLEVSADMMQGISKLSPEALVALKKLAGNEQRTMAFRIISWAKDGTVALGINKLAEHVRTDQVGDIASALGEDILKRVAGPGLDDLMALVKKPPRGQSAYKTLLKGGKTKDGRIVIGLDDRLIAQRRAAGGLSGELEAIQKQVAVFLTTEQLTGLSRLNEQTRRLLMDVPDSQLREIAKVAWRMPGAAGGIERLAAALGGKVPRGVLPEIVQKLGPGLLTAVEQLRIAIPPELVAALAKPAAMANPMKIVIAGAKGAKGVKAATGLFDLMAQAMTEAHLLETLKRIENTTVRGELFSRWAVAARNAGKIPGIDTVKKFRTSDAQQRIAAIVRDFGDDGARRIFEQLQRMDAAKVSDGMSALVAELGAGFDKAMGASLTLQYAAQKLDPSMIQAFEKVAETAGGEKRLYDLVAGGTSYEFKYWLTYGGDKVDAAMGEFRRDILIHAKDGFTNLRWVFSTDVTAFRDAIAERMMSTLEASRSAVKDLNLNFDKVRADLDAALNSKQRWLLEFQ